MISEDKIIKFKMEYINDWLLNKVELRSSLRSIIEGIINSQNIYIDPPPDNVIIIFSHFCLKNKGLDSLSNIVDTCKRYNVKQNSKGCKALSIVILYFCSFLLNENIPYENILSRCNIKKEDFSQKELLEIANKSECLIEEIFKNVVRAKD